MISHLPDSSSPEDLPGGATASRLLPLPSGLMERLRRALQTYLPTSDQTLIDEVCSFIAATATDSAQVRDILNVGIILADMHIDATGITAGMVQHVAVDPDKHAVISDIGNRVTDEFGADVYYLLDNVAHFSAIEAQRRNKHFVNTPRKREGPEQARHMQLEKVRKMFVAMGDDPRIVVFKLADHLAQMRERTLPPDDMLLLAEESRDIYAPLAGRLGMGRVEAELDDLAFALLQPEDFRRVSNLVDQVRQEQKGYIDRVCQMLRDEAAKINITADVSGRYKHMWSIYRKLARNGWDIHQVYDLIAFRILVPTVGECYAMLGQVHALWQPKEDRIKDFIAHRKANGYQSLHTTVFCLDRRLAEIQIRTPEMHQHAEYGAAMHWYYKDVGDDATMDKRLAPWVKQIREWKNDLQQRDDQDAPTVAVASPEAAAAQERIFVFTPHGDVKDLPRGSTPVDFAYQIHSDLGQHCAGARIIITGQQVAKRMVPLDYRLENGQIVEIITRRDAHPTRDWLKFARTHAARSHINRYLKLHERDIYITVGRERLDAELRRAGLGTLDALSEETLHTIITQLEYEKPEELFADIGGDTLRVSAVIQAIQAHLKSIAPITPLPVTPAPPPSPSLPTSDAVLNVAGVGGLLARLANCCHPLPGDPIIGFISRGRGIVIHHTHCRTLHRQREREAERLIGVDWSQMRLDRYDAPITIFAHDRTGLVRDITQQIGEMKINMQSVSSVTNRKGQAIISLTLQLQLHTDKRTDERPQEEIVKQLLEEALRRIRAIRDVQDVQRDTHALVEDAISLP